ncbi:hypothetical protein [Microbacterium schleiferi]|uniref:MarR family transcriptional regulator n=1 Tax=Microbacterium schleiferi TaxID=69362 RepID=A0ABU7V3T3_9MICO|nr:hypothetical protein [Micrococcales bacterium]
MSNSGIYGTDDLLDRLFLTLQRLTPGAVLQPVSRRVADGFDALLDADILGERLELDVEIKLSPVRSRDEAGRAVQGVASPGGMPLLAAPYISPAARSELADRGWSYWDATGNLLVQSRDPIVWIREGGADREPGGSAGLGREKLRSLKGRAASELIVYLLTQGEAASVRELSRATKVSVASASRVVDLLRDEGLLKDTNGGKIALIDRMAVAERWAHDYSFAKSFAATRYFSIAGDEIALERIRDSGVEYALTGARAASLYLGEHGKVAPLPSTETWMYVADLKAVERAADLVPDPKSGSILIAEADFLTRDGSREGFNASATPIARPWRIAGDLLSAGGRLSALGQTLADVLAKEAIY